MEDGEMGKTGKTMTDEMMQGRQAGKGTGTRRITG